MGGMQWGKAYTKTTGAEALIERGHEIVEKLIPLSAEIRPRLTESDCTDMNSMATLTLNGAGWKPTEETRAAVEALIYFGIVLGMRLKGEESK